MNFACSIASHGFHLLHRKARISLAPSRVLDFACSIAISRKSALHRVIELVAPTRHCETRPFIVDIAKFALQSQHSLLQFVSKKTTSKKGHKTKGVDDEKDRKSNLTKLRQSFHQSQREESSTAECGTDTKTKGVPIVPE